MLDQVANTHYRRSSATWLWCNKLAFHATTRFIPFVYSSIVDTINSRRQSSVSADTHLTLSFAVIEL